MAFASLGVRTGNMDEAKSEATLLCLKYLSKLSLLSSDIYML